MRAGSAPPAAAAKGPTSPMPGALSSPADLACENAKLKRELDRMRLERDLLKTTIGILAEASR